MAYCATVSLHDDTGKALHTVKYGRMGPSPDSHEYVSKADVKSLMRQLIVDVTTLRKGRRLRVVLLADGASELWNLFTHYLNEKTLGVRPVMLHPRSLLSSADIHRGCSPRGSLVPCDRSASTTIINQLVHSRALSVSRHLDLGTIHPFRCIVRRCTGLRKVHRQSSCT